MVTPLDSASVEEDTDKNKPVCRITYIHADLLTLHCLGQ